MSDDLEAMKVAFAWHMAREIVLADDEAAAPELAWLDVHFPPALLRGLGFLGAGAGGAEGPTEVFGEALARAVIELPDRLTAGEKLQLLETLVEVTAADGVLAAEEMDALAAAARVLGVDDRAWTGLVDELLASGRMRSDDCAE